MSNLNPNGETKSWWRRYLVEGPDPEIGKWLPWSLRLAIVVGAALIGWIWDGMPSGKQLTWGLQYAALIGVSLVASLWAILLVINVLLGASWLYLSWKPLAPVEAQPSMTPLSVATFWNRQWGHAEALATWAAFALVVYPTLSVQLPSVAGLLLLGPPFVNGFTRLAAPVNQRPTKETGDLQLERRLWVYLATLIGLGLLSLCAPQQFKKLLPLHLMLGGGLVLRYWRFRRRKAQEHDRPDVREQRQAVVKQRSDRARPPWTSRSARS